MKYFFTVNLTKDDEELLIQIAAKHGFDLSGKNYRLRRDRIHKGLTFLLAEAFKEKQP